MIEYQILQAMVNDEDYTRQVSPFLKSEYFTQPDQKLIYKLISCLLYTSDAADE